MLNRFRIDFDDIYNYATQKPQSIQLEQVLANTDQDISESNLETINKYSYIYCESNNTFADQVGREFCVSAKSYGLWGLKAAAVGTGVSLGFDGSPTASAAALTIGGAGGAVLGGVVGGLRAINTRVHGMLLKTPEEKERVAELQKIAENRVAFFSSANTKNTKHKKNKSIEIVIENKDDEIRLARSR